MKPIKSYTALFFLTIIISFSVVLLINASPIHETTEDIGQIELVSATSQTVTLQLTIPKSDFRIEAHEQDGEQFQSISFPKCRFTTESDYPRLPMQTTMIGIPSEASFTVQIVESNDFSTYTLQHTLADNRVIFGKHNPERVTLKSKTNPIYSTNRFYPDNLAKAGIPGQIRENRVLPIQLYPVQYNPVSGVVKLYHRLVVEVQFNGLGKAPAANRGVPLPESTVYEEMFGDLLVNPQTAKQWRSPRMNTISRDDLGRDGTLTTRDSAFSIPSAPGIGTPRYKVIITTTGMYRITASDLVAAGADISTIRPSTLALSNKGKQIPIFVRNVGNGQTSDDASDLKADAEIIFYAQRHSGEKTYFDPYTDENVYWLSWNAGPGLRMETRTISDDDSIRYEPQNFLTRVHVEKDNHFRRFKNFGLDQEIDTEQFSDGILQFRDYTLTSLPDLPDDSWFWAQISAAEIRNFPFHLAGVAGTGNKATVRISLHGRTEGSHFTELWLNNDDVFGRARWIGDTEFRYENNEISQSVLKEGRNTFGAVSPEEDQLDFVMINWFQIDYWRTYQVINNVLPFSVTLLPDDITGQVNPNFRVVLTDFTNPNIEIYSVDGTRYVGIAPIEDKDNPGVYDVVFQSTRIGGIPQFQPDEPPDHDTSIQYYALTRDKYQKPDRIVKDSPSDLRGSHNGADYIIITATELLRDVQPLANFRSQQGLRTKVVDVQDIYDEFNHGIINPYAIKDFLNYAYENWQPPAPTYVLLVGDANPIDKTSVVPTIQIQVPGYGSSSSDHQFVTFRGDDFFPDMIIGRVPTTNSVDTRIFVDRAINYESTVKNAPWNKRILMLAGSSYDFHTQTDALIAENRLIQKYETELIYAPPSVGDDQLIGEGSTPVGREVIDGFNNGASLVNYVGHGAGGRWASSRMMDLEDPQKNLTNISQLPFVISMTCFTGEFDSKTGCLAEEFLRSENGGAIAVIGGTSIGLLHEDHVLNKEIFEVIFHDNTQHVGAILANAKTRFLINLPGVPDLTEVFTLFGDPATRLRLPHTKMQVDVQTGKVLHRDVFEDKTRLSVSGKLSDPSFNGEAEVTVLPNLPNRDEKKLRSSYRSSSTSPRYGMDVTPRMETAQVVNGQFSAQVQLPINSAFDSWHVRTYAWNDEKDAIGYLTSHPIDRYIENVRVEPSFVLPQQPIHIYADGVNVSEIDEITLYWSTFYIESRRSEAEAIPMVQHTGITYRTQQPIPAHESGDQIDYYILVKPKDGRILQTEVVTFSIGKTDLTISEDSLDWDTDAPFHLSAHISNDGLIHAKDVPVRFFHIPVVEDSETQAVTPETLQNATPIGDVYIIPEIPPDRTVAASVPWKPAPGKYLVTVYVDMPTTEKPEGILPELDENDNSASREFVNTRVFLATEDVDKPFQSLDGKFRITLAPGSLETHNTMTFETETLTIKNQPDIDLLPTLEPETKPVAYRLRLSEQTELAATATFVKTAGENLHIYMRDDQTDNWILVGKQTDAEDTISAQVKLPGTFALLSHTDAQPPSVEVSVENQGFIDGDYISDTPVFSARIEDANGIDPRPENIVLTKNGNRVPQDEYTISASPLSSNVLLITYSPINALDAGEYRIRLQAQDANGNMGNTDLTARVAGGFEIKNIANFPNPFRPGKGTGKGTDFAYYLTGGADKVSLKIYTLTGKLITTIDTLDASISYNEYHFDGLDADGDPLANGVYIYKFTATKDGERAQKVGKIVVLK